MRKNRKIKYIRFVITYNIVMMIPLVLISFSVLFLFHKQQQQKIKDEMSIVMERQEDFWRQQMSVVRAFTASCKYDKKYNERYSEVPEVYFDIQQELSKQEENFPFADGIFLYDKEKGVVVSSSGNIKENLFFTNFCKMDPTVFNTVEDGEISAYSSYLRMDSRPGIVLVAPMKTYGVDATAMRYLLYTIKNEKLAAQFGGDREDCTVIRYCERVLYASEGWKTEEDWDEKNANMISSGMYYVFQADLGYGFDVISYIPQNSIAKSISIYLKGYGIWLLCSILIGLGLALLFSHNRYEMFLELTDHNEKLQAERDVLQRESCLYELLSKKMVDEDALWKKCLENQIYVNRKYKFFVVVTADKLGNQVVYDWFDHQMNKYGVTSSYQIEVVEGILIYFVCSDEPDFDLTERINELAQNIEQIGVGSFVTDVRNLRRSYKEAQKQLNASRKEDSYPEREVLSLKEATEDGDTARAKLLLETLQELVKSMNEMTATAVLWDVARLYQKNASEVLEMPRGEQESMGDFTRSFLRYLSDHMPKEQKAEYKAAGYKKRNIVDILSYIHEHYLDDNFSVKYLAAYFETSISNISHFFKKNVGVTISQYIDQIKLEKAKELLENSDSKISEIAQTLRYNNSTVFIEMFKKYEGVTPGGYRENRRSKLQ